MSDDELRAQLAALREEVADLKTQVAAVKPPPSVKELVDAAMGPPGPTTTQIAINNLGMSREVHAEFARTIPTAMVRDIVNGNRAPSDLAPLGGGSAGPRVASGNRSGWREPAPLDVPGGASTHALIERGANAHLPHGPANPVGAKGKEG